jgi:hypothetical protein
MTVWISRFCLSLLIGAAGFSLIARDASASVANQTTYARVIKPLGAAVRSVPISGEAHTIQFVADCNDVFPVVGSNGPWVQVWAVGPFGSDFGWIGSARVAVGPNPPPANCAGAVTYQIGARVATSVSSGCLSLRHTPSRSAGYDHCVPNGFLYQVINGPIEVSGEDWIEVYNDFTGRGWVLGEFLYPAY